MTKLKLLLAKFWKLVPSLIFVFTICVIFSDLALAKDGGLPIAKTEILKIIAYAVKFIAYLAYVFALFVGDLMDSSLIVDSGMGDTLHLIWETMRNFVNIAFIIILLIIAVMVVFGGGGEKGLGMLKKVLPKFVLALVLVNFTFFIARFILTTNDVLTTAVLTIPQTITSEKIVYLPWKTEESGEYRKEIIDNTLNFAPGFQGTQVKIDQALDYLSDLHEHKLADTLDKKNIALVLTTYMLDLEHLIKSKALSGNWDAFLGSIGAIITAVVAGLVIFMLFLALVVRMVVLWIVIAVSPLAALATVLGEVIPGLNTKGDFDLLSIFFKHAFMPVLISIPLVIGLIMIFANNAIGYDISLNTFFSLSGDSAADNLYSLLWWIASIIVIWYGTNMMIKKSSDYATQLTEKVHSGVNKFVGGAASTLQYVPFIPTDQNNDRKFEKHERRSLAYYTQAPGYVKSALVGQAGNRAGELASKLAPSIGYIPQTMSNMTFNTKIREAKVSNFVELAKILHELIKQGATSKNTIDEASAKKLWKENNAIFQKIGISSKEQLRKSNIRSILEGIESKSQSADAKTEAHAARQKLDLNDKNTPEEKSNNKKQKIEKETDIKSDVAGKQVGKDSIKGDLGEMEKDEKNKKNVEIDGEVLHKIEVKKEDGSIEIMYGTENKDKSWTIAFSERELNDKINDLKSDIQTADTNTDMDSLRDRILALQEKYGDFAMKQLEGINVTDNKGREKLKVYINNSRINSKNIIK